MNLQNIPRTDSVIRGAFVPKLDYILCCDYSNIELRFLAYYLSEAVGDVSMVMEFEAGDDLHEKTSEGMWPGIDPRTPWPVPAPSVKDYRDAAKKMNFSIVYGGGTKTLIKQGLAEDYVGAIKILNQFDEARPGIKSLGRMVQERLKERGYIETPWGRRLHPTTEHKALNALIQGAAADLIKDAIVNTYIGMNELELQSHMIATIHDEIQIDGVETELGWIKHYIPLWMGNPMIENVVPIDVDISICRLSWAGKEPLVL